MFTVKDFTETKKAGGRIVMLTCYDAPGARLLAESGVDAILVGDSAAMTVHGMASTIPATLELLEPHVRAVRAGAPDMFIVADMPFLSTRLSTEASVEIAGRFIRAGANAVKIEGASGHEDIIPRLTGSGIPAMGHLGLTPQSVNALGGYRAQGTDDESASRILADAKLLESLGCFSLVLECVPSSLGAEVTRSLSIPVIGIGAGPATDGQILVYHDMLGFTGGRVPRFVRKYADAAGMIKGAASSFADDVRSGLYPSEAECYGK